MGHRLRPQPSGSAANPTSRRVSQRSRLRIKADVTLPGDLTIVGHTVDVSAAGMSIEAPYPLVVGQRCEIEMNLNKLGGPSWVQVVGEVRHCSQSDDGLYRAGLQFVDISDAARTALEQYVWSQITDAHSGPVSTN